MKFISFIGFAPVLLAVGAGIPALAADIAVRLTGDQELPAVTSAATGVVHSAEHKGGEIRTQLKP